MLLAGELLVALSYALFLVLEALYYTYMCIYLLFHVCVFRFMQPWAIVMLGGVLPFGSIFIEV